MARDKEKIKKIKKRYYEKHREEIIEKAKNYNFLHKDEVNEWNRFYMKARNDESLEKAYKGYEKWTPSEDATLLELANEGIPYSQIAEELGRSIAGVAHRLTRLRREKDYD